MRLKIRYLAAFFSVNLWAFSALQAQSLNVSIRPDSSETTTPITIDNPASKQVSYYFVSSGNSSNVIYMSFAAPPGTNVKVRSRYLAKGSAEAALSSSSGWTEQKLYSVYDKAVKNSYNFPKADLPQTSAAIDCSNMTVEMVRVVIEIYRETTGITLTVEEMCGGTTPKEPNDGGTNPGDPNSGNPGDSNGGTTPGSGGNNGSPSTYSSDSYFRVYLSKDACAPASKSKYLVEIQYDLTAVPQEFIDAGTTIGAIVTERKFTGNRGASIKPVSDGKYAPKPLILMASPGVNLSEDQISLLKFKKGKLQSRRVLKYAKALYYKGMFLSSALLDGVLKGGKGTFEIANDDLMYSVCFKLERKRQSVNGYPK